MNKSGKSGTRFFTVYKCEHSRQKKYETVMILFTGVCRPHMTIRKGKRCSTAKAYLRPAMKRRDLHVVAESHVTKVCLLACLAHLIHRSFFSSNVNFMYRFNHLVPEAIGVG